MRQKRAVKGANKTPRDAYSLRFEPELLAELREVSQLAGYPWRASAIVKYCVKIGLPAFREMIANGGVVPSGNGAKKVA